MKNAFATSNNDNIASATLLAVSLFAVASGVLTSNSAVAGHAATVGIQKMDTIVVTAQRTPAATLETMVVTASRIRHA